MLCDFRKLDSGRWICERCGRISQIGEGQIYSPVAKCRIPEDYHLTTDRYIKSTKNLGVGDMIARCIKKLGYRYDTNSVARSKITYLNKKGIEWCDNNQEIILEWLAEECGPRRVVPNKKPLKAIIRMAIRQAKYQT